MATEKEPYYYNYQELDKFLSSQYDPRDLANELDEIMTDLVVYSGWDDRYYLFLEKRFLTLRYLRDIFWDTLPEDKSKVADALNHDKPKWNNIDL
jgi:hypothetical protein